MRRPGTIVLDGPPATVKIANAGRATFFRNVANVTMDPNNVEAIDFRALGGGDTILVHDLSGTDVAGVKVDLEAAGGTGDGQTDTVVVNAMGFPQAHVEQGDGPESERVSVGVVTSIVAIWQ